MEKSDASTGKKQWQGHTLEPSSTVRKDTSYSDTEHSKSTKPICKIDSESEFETLCSDLSNLIRTKGFEAHPLLIGWYNDHVGEKFKLNYASDTLAFVIISTPSMFEKCFLPYVSTKPLDVILDPIDSCIKDEMATVKEKFSKFDIECIHDFELGHSRRPRVLVQTAGHLSGAAYYYQRKDVHSPWNREKPIYGVSIHPKFGGWFALRCLLIFENLQYRDLNRREADDVVKSDDKRIELLEKFTDSWQDGSYRDIIPVKERYSERQIEYFQTLPRDRKQLISRWLDHDHDDKE